MTGYNDAQGQALLLRLANGEGLWRICRDPEMPCTAEVLAWRRDFPHFANLYTEARQMQAEALRDEVLDIADSCDDLARAKLQIEARKWLVAGITGEDEPPIWVARMTPEARKARIEELLRKAGSSESDPAARS